MMAPKDPLKLNGVRKRVGAFTLAADFEVSPGERLALIGRSGSGKTTLLRLIAGLEPLDAGIIRLGKVELSALSPQKRGIGMVFQEHALFPSLNVVENAAFALQARGVPREEREARALEWLDRVGLQGMAHASISRLSGGEAQRVAFVRALISEPRILLLDEPFSALDADLRHVLRRELVSLHALWPAPLLIVSHDEADRQELATGRLLLSEENEGSVRRVCRGV